MSRTTTESKLPARLDGTEPGTFAHHTITVRWPRIARDVIAENDFSSSVEGQLQALIDEIPEGPIRFLDDQAAPDEQLWNERIVPYRGDSWLECPWFFGETYFYRRIIEAVGYFQEGRYRTVDPFSKQKDLGYSESVESTHALAKARLEALESGSTRNELVRLVSTALWGNQADLSMWGADEEGPDHLGTGREEEHLLADDSVAALEYLEGLGRTGRVDVWADNAGFELVTDLALVDGLLTSGLANPIVLHLKAHPTFVSDATVDDVHDTLDRFADAEHEATRALSDRLRSALGNGQLRLYDHFAWTSPLPAREFPKNVNAELARADLVISKGDANYRRLLGDRQWTYTTPFTDVVDYFPAPVLALRTCKAEVVAGLSQEQVRHLQQTDPKWMVNGKWGLIQFAP